MRTENSGRSAGPSRRLRAFAVTCIVALGGLTLAAPAQAGERDLADLADIASVGKMVATQKDGGRGGAAPKPPARSGLSDGGDAVGRAVGLGVGGNEIAVIGESKAGGSSKDGATAESRSLSVLGATVVGSSAEAESQGSKKGKDKGKRVRRQKEGDFLLPLCEGSGGALCAELLYADSESSTKKAKARSGLLHVCVGGDDRSGDTCTGPIEASVLTSEAFHVIEDDGTQRTGGSSEVLGLCLTSTGGSCDLGLSLLGSDGALDSDGGSDQRSSIIAGELMGNEAGGDGAAQALGIPSCDDVSLICLGLNQSQAEQREDGTVLLGGSPLAAGVLSDGIAAALAANESGARAARGGDRGDGGRSDDGGSGDGGSGSGDSTSPVNAGGIPGGGLLPSTGGPALSLLLLALGAIAGGAALRRSARA